MERERKRYAIFLSTHTTAYAIIAIFLVLAWIPFDYLIDRKHFLLFLLFRISFTGNWVFSYTYSLLRRFFP